MVVPGAHSEERAPRVLVSVAVVAVVAIDVLYLSLIAGQGGPPSDTPLVVPFVGAYFAVLATSLGVSLAAPAWLKAALRGAACAGLLLMAVLTGFSIGVAVLVAAAVALAALVFTLAARPNRRAVGAAIIGGIVGVAILMAGLQLAWSQISCPRTGESSGTTVSLTGQSSYRCIEGVLTISH